MDDETIAAGGHRILPRGVQRLKLAGIRTEHTGARDVVIAIAVEGNVSVRGNRLLQIAGGIADQINHVAKVPAPVQQPVAAGVPGWRLRGGWENGGPENYQHYPHQSHKVHYSHVRLHTVLRSPARKVPLSGSIAAKDPVPL